MPPFSSRDMLRRLVMRVIRPEHVLILIPTRQFFFSYHHAHVSGFDAVRKSKQRIDIELTDLGILDQHLRDALDRLD